MMVMASMMPYPSSYSLYVDVDVVDVDVVDGCWVELDLVPCLESMPNSSNYNLFAAPIAADKFVVVGVC